jgi:DNA polymerase
MHDSFEKPAEVERALRIIAQRSIELLDYEYGPGSAWAQKHGLKDGLDPLEVVASCLRSLIVAPPGYRLISADFNSIQAVVTSALAGEEWRLEVFRTHGKIYETMGARLTGLSLEEVLEHKRRTGKHHACRQNPGKLAVLSGDFGAWINGWKRFGADKLLGSDENIKAAILKTRAAQPAIVEFWGGQTRDKFRWNERPELYGLEGAVVSAIQNPGQAFEARQLSGAPTGVVYQMHGPDLCCKTPADWADDDGTPREDVMRYHNARLEPSGRSYARPWEFEVFYEGHNTNAQKGAPGWQTMALYAGVLTQNVVSRVSRQVQARAMLRLQAHGWPIVHHTHDENVCEVPIGSHHTTAEHTRLTAQLEPWAVDPQGRPWPIKVPDSWEHPRYGKW